MAPESHIKHPFQLLGGGTCGDLFRSINWAKHPMGPPSTWSASLKSSLNILFNSQHPMFIWWGPELYQFYNDAYLPSFGEGKHPSAMGQRGEDCWPEIWPIIKPQIDLVMEGKGSTWHEDQLVPIFRNGAIEDVYWTYGYSPIFNHDGTIGGTLVVCTETTKKIESLRALEESAERNKLVQDQLIDTLESMSDAFISVDKNWIITHVNSHATKISQTSREDLLGSNFLQLFYSTPEQQKTYAWNQYNKAMDERISIVFEDYYAPLDIWTRCNVYPTSDGGLSIFFSDISEQKNYELDIEAERRKLNLIFEESPAAIAILRGPTLIYEKVNARYQEYMPDKDIIGKTRREVIPNEDQSRFDSLLEKVFKTGETISEKEAMAKVPRLVNGKREEVYVYFKFSRIEDRLGKPYGVFIHAMDVTEKVLARRRIEEQAKELQIAKAGAENAALAKSEFLANMSHEIRTPLSAILGFTEVLRTPELETEQQNSYLEIIHRNGLALTKIIDDILDLSKIEAGKIEMEKAPLCLQDVVRDVVKMFSDRAIGKGLHLKIEEEGFPTFKIASDAIRIRQVLINLIGNAIKFTSAGSVIVRCKQEKLKDNKVRVSFFVEDTGIGMSAQQVSQLFIPFTQGDQKNSRRFGGTGLGLALSKKLAWALGGDISVDVYKENEGCTFRFDIVASESLESHTENVQMTTSKISKSAYRLSDMNILLVDDSPDNRDLIDFILKREGAEVDQAENGTQAVELALENDYDIVLMDIQMPGIDGYDTLKKLREKKYRKPVIALTAHAMKEEKSRAMAAGFTDHLPKPVNPDHLVESILLHSKKN